MGAGAALIAGATGLVGSACLDALLSCGAYNRVTAVGRTPPARTHPLLQFLPLSFRDLGPSTALPSADDVFCCLGTTIADAGSREAFRTVDHDYPVSLAAVMLAAGARRFLVVSSVGADPASSTFYLRVKGEMERDLRAAGFEGLDIFRPSLLLGERPRPRPAERAAGAIGTLVGPLLAGPLARYRPVPGATVGRAMVARALERSDGAAVHHAPEILRLARRMGP